MIQLRRHRVCSLFNMVRTRTGSDSGGMHGSSRSTVGVALASTIGVAQLITNYSCLML